jgi:lysophospholipase L1-like esterase
VKRLLKTHLSIVAGDVDIYGMFNERRQIDCVQCTSQSFKVTNVVVTNVISGGSTSDTVTNSGTVMITRSRILLARVGMVFTVE